MRSPSPKSFLLVLLLLVAGTMPAASMAQRTSLELPSLFSDHMVIQREDSVHVWGWAAAGDTVTVDLAGTSAEAVATEDGSWRVALPPMEAGGPHVLTVSASETLRFEDVLVGDVWLAGGQSNMEWPVVASNDAESEIAAANFPQIRLFTVERGFSGQALDDVVSSGWHPVTPNNVRDFSAVAYFFGRRLHQELGVPIGLLESNWGGSSAEAWMSPERLAEHPDFQAMADSMLGGSLSPQVIYDRGMAAYRTRLTEWMESARAEDPGFSVEGAVWAHPSFTPVNWDTMNVPGAWEESGLPGYDGIVWMRKTFELSGEQVTKDLHIDFGRIDGGDSTWVNGVLVGGEWAPGERTYKVPAEHLHAGENVLTVRIVDQWGPGGIRGRADGIRAWVEGAESAPISLSGPWAYRAAVRMSDLPPMPQMPQQNQIPAGLHNAMIAPVTPFAIRGVIWYQGETNAGRAYQYRTLFPKLIEDWRTEFDDPEMPFLFVQLANFMDAQDDPNAQSAWAELREAQTMTLQVPHTAMAVAIDVGDANDIHPRDKQTVGQRLALAALGTVYDRDVVYSGPQYVGMRIDGRGIRLLFTHIGSGLVARGERLRGFALAGPDGDFRWADARMEDGNSILVTHPSIDDPRAVRYNWANNPSGNLYNREGLPAIPFRTDDLPGITQPR